MGLHGAHDRRGNATILKAFSPMVLRPSPVPFSPGPRLSRLRQNLLRVFMFCAGPITLLAAQNAPVRVAVGGEFSGRLGRRSVVRYSLHLEAGDYARLTVDQTDLDIVAQLHPPGGRPVEVIDCFEHGPEPIWWIAAVSGDYVIELRPMKSWTVEPRYRLKIEEVRPSRADDEALVRAVRVSSEVKALVKASGDAAHRRAAELAGKALGLWRGLATPKLELMAVIAAGDAQVSLGHYGEASEFYDRGLSLSRVLSDRRAEGELLNDIGLSLWNREDFDGALAKLREAIEIWEPLHYRYGLAAAESNSGIIYRQTGVYDQAVAHYGLALDLIKGIDLTGEAFVENNLGVTYSSLGDYEKAVRHLRRARALFLGSGEQRAAARSLLMLGRLDLALGRPAAARDQIVTALAEIRKAGDRQWEVDALIALGQTLAKLGMPVGALARFQSALASASAAGYLRGKAAALHEIGVAQTAAGAFGDAMDSLRAALSLRRSLGLRDAEADTLYSLARCELAAGHLNEATATAQASEGLTDSIVNAIPGDQFRVSYMTAHRQRSVFLVQLLMTLHSRSPAAGFDRQAIEAAERGSARGLLSLLGPARDSIAKGVGGDLLDRSSQLRRQINNESRLFTAEASRGDSTRDARMQALLDRYEETEAGIRAANPAYAALTSAQPASLARIQSELGSDSAPVLVEYLLDEEQSYAWAITADSVHSFVLAPRSRIEAAARNFHAAFLAGAPKPGASACSDAGRALSALVLRPLQQEFGSKKIIVVGDGLLHYVPFAALPVEGPACRLLIDRNEVVHLPSASVLVHLRSRLPQPDHRRALAVIADPVYDAGDSRVSRRAIRTPEPTGEQFLRLLYSRSEALGAWSQAPADSRMLAVDFDASKATLTGPALRDYRVIHISSHGYYNNDRPELSGLVLSTVRSDGSPVDGMIYLHDIFNLDLSADLVVLSACQSALLGREAPGEGLVGLVRGFFYAGATRLIVSLWSVDDESTSVLMGAFYRRLFSADHPSPAGALRASQLELRRSPRFGHPYYWAAFELQGDYE
jgi:CHAT domain-containing protein/Flp pilus assembly protein TadD